MLSSTAVNTPCRSRYCHRHPPPIDAANGCFPFAVDERTCRPSVCNRVASIGNGNYGHWEWSHHTRTCRGCLDKSAPPEQARQLLPNRLESSSRNSRGAGNLSALRRINVEAVEERRFTSNLPRATTRRCLWRRHENAAHRRRYFQLSGVSHAGVSY